MNKLESIEPQKIPFPIKDMQEEKKELSPRDKIHNRIKEIIGFIESRFSINGYEEIFREYNIHVIQDKIVALENMIEEDSTISPVYDNHFYHTLGNFATGLLTLDRVKRKVASQELQASNQKNIIEVNLHLDRMKQDKDYFRESLETQHGYKKTLH